MRIDHYNQSDRNVEAAGKCCGCVIFMILLGVCCVISPLIIKSIPASMKEPSVVVMPKVEVKEEVVTMPKEVPPKEETPKVPTRKEFTKSVIGKTEDEVMFILGKPHAIDKFVNYSSWRYKERSRDPITDKIDSVQRLEFVKGKVDKVWYTP